MSHPLTEARRLLAAGQKARVEGRYLDEAAALRDALHRFIQAALGMPPRDHFPDGDALLQAFGASDAEERYGMAITAARLAKAFLDGGQPQLALVWCQVAGRFLVEFGDPDARQVLCRLEVTHATALRWLNRYDEAEERLDICESLAAPEWLADRVAIALVSCAIAHRTGRRERAVARLREVEPMVDGALAPEMLAWVLANRAVIDDAAARRFDAAVERLLRARAVLMLSRSAGDRLSEIELSLAQFAVLGGDPRAVEFATRALAREARRPRPDTTWRVFEVAALACVPGGDPWLAILLLKRAVDCIESMRRMRAREDAYLAELVQHGPEFVYDTLARVLARHGRPGEARAVIDRRMTLAVAGDTAWPLALTPEEEAASADLDAALAAQAAACTPEALARDLRTISGRLNATRDHVRDQAARLNERLQADQRSRMPASCRLDTVVVHVLQEANLVAVRATLDGNDLLPGGLAEVAVPAPDIYELAAAFHDAIAAHRSGDRARAGRELHRLLVEPVLANLPAGVQRLLVCAPGPLHGLPWAALTDEEGQFLVERLDIVRATAPDVDLTRAPSQPLRVLACAAAGGAGGHSPLEHALEEARLLGAQAVLAGPNEFTLAALRTALPGASVLHVASHFLADPADVTKSRLLLGDGHECPLPELAALGLGHLDLLVLSACESGVAAGHGAHGNFAIDHVLHAGRVPAVIGTLFPVDDASTAALMAHLHARLRAGDDKARALCDAQRVAIRGDRGPAWRQPFFWAAPALSGNWLAWPRPAAA